MVKLWTCLGALLSTQLAAAQRSSTQSVEPCAQISASIASYRSANPSATSNPRIAYSVMSDCRASVSLDKDDATMLLDGLMAMFEFQSDLQYKANPPSGYLLAPVDVEGDLQKLKESVQSGAIQNEFDFQTQLQTILAQTHDGHISFRPDGLTVLRSTRNVGPLISISSDGLEIPSLYFYFDLISFASGVGPEPSAITQINDMDPVAFILQEQQNKTYTGYQDPDALYNAYLFSFNGGLPNLINWGGLFAGFSLVDVGPTTSIKFENGTTWSEDNDGLAIGNFSGVVDGRSFYQQFLNATVKAEIITASRSAQSMSATATASAVPTATNAVGAAIPIRAAAQNVAASDELQIAGYPLPVVISSDATASGYFLQSPGFEDVAVLALRAMSENDPETFQATITEFLNQCRSTNKKRLIIDVSGNPGGVITLGLDVFKQLFPSLEPYGASNTRASEGFRLLSEAISPWSRANLQQNSSNLTTLDVSAFAAYTFLNATNQAFETFDDFYGPVASPSGRDNYTELFRWNVSNSLFTERVGSITVSGYGDRANIGPQPFSSENIIILSDGRCSSTCTVMTHYLKYQGKVKSVVMGGRPYQASMQTSGGIKGAQAQTLQQLWNEIIQAYTTFSSSITDAWQNTSLQTLYDSGKYLIYRSASVGQMTDDIRFNYKNNIAEGDSSRTPLQYVYEAADCKMFYKASHIVNITNIWVDVAANAFGLNGTQVFERCVPGSTNHPSSLSGNAVLYDNGQISNNTNLISQGLQSQTANGDGNGEQNSASTQRFSVCAVITALIAALVV